MFGGPGQEAAGTSVSNWYCGLTPEQQQQVAALAYANRGNVGPYVQSPLTGGPLTMGNLLRDAFPGLKGAYLEGIYGLEPNTWLGMSPQEQARVRREHDYRQEHLASNQSMMNLLG